MTFWHKGKDFSMIASHLLTGEAVPKIVIHNGRNAQEAAPVLHRAHRFCRTIFGEDISFSPSREDRNYCEFILNAAL